MIDLVGAVGGSRSIRQPSEIEASRGIKSTCENDCVANFGELVSTASKAPSAHTAPLSKAAIAHREFETFVLQNFIEAMLPHDAEKVFGQGIAGETWKSMLAEKLAVEVAKASGIGIAERIASAGKVHTAREVNFELRT